MEGGTADMSEKRIRADVDRADRAGSGSAQLVPESQSVPATLQRIYVDDVLQFSKLSSKV